MSRSMHVAVVGATGVVGQEILASLAARKFPLTKLGLLASKRSAGQSVTFEGDNHIVGEATADSFAGVDLVLMSAGKKASLTLAPMAAAAGAVVIDNSSAWRQDVAVPLVVPEVNGYLCIEPLAKNIIANPNCATIQMVVALAALHREATLTRLVVSTYQAVSGSGQGGISELGEQVAALFNQGEFTPKVYARRIAFNCLPQIDAFGPGDHTGEEQKIAAETRKIFALPNLPIMATCVRVPIFNGHSVSICAHFANAIDAARAQAVLAQAQGVLLMDDPKQNIYPTPIDAEGQDATLVGRVRGVLDDPRALGLWCVADNLRKGAATNAVQIAEKWLERPNAGASPA